MNFEDEYEEGLRLVSAVAGRFRGIGLGENREETAAMALRQVPLYMELFHKKFTHPDEIFDLTPRLVASPPTIENLEVAVLTLKKVIQAYTLNFLAMPQLIAEVGRTRARDMQLVEETLEILDKCCTAISKDDGRVALSTFIQHIFILLSIETKLRDYSVPICLAKASRRRIEAILEAMKMRRVQAQPPGNSRVRAQQHRAQERQREQARKQRIKEARTQDKEREAALKKNPAPPISRYESIVFLFQHGQPWLPALHRILHPPRGLVRRNSFPLSQREDEEYPETLPCPVDGLVKRHPSWPLTTKEMATVELAAKGWKPLKVPVNKRRPGDMLSMVRVRRCI